MWLLGVALAHPGGLAAGVASCGEEYVTAETAFIVPDITEAWYVRRVSTCASPYFWVTWDAPDFTTTGEGKALYIAAISPEIERFKDKLQMRGILFGPGLPALEDALPDGVEAPAGAPLTGIVLEPPEDYGDCGFVKTNPVMRKYATEVDGRCMELLELDADYDKDPLRAGRTWRSWWLYSKEFYHADAGTYHLVTWLEDRATGQVTTGKYEMTLGPHTWYGYADEATLADAQEQGTRCFCATSAVSYLEQHLDRLNTAPREMWPLELPAECPSRCVAQPEVAHVPGVEWAGQYELQNGTYSWTLHAFGEPFTYPDETMKAMLLKCDTLEASTPAQLSGGVPAEPGSSFGLGVVELQFAPDQASGGAEPFTRWSIDIPTAGTYCLFTQHVPSEFLAHYFQDEAGELVFPDVSFLFAGEPEPEEPAEGPHDHGDGEVHDHDDHDHDDGDDHDDHGDAHDHDDHDHDDDDGDDGDGATADAGARRRGVAPRTSAVWRAAPLLLAGL